MTPNKKRAAQPKKAEPKRRWPARMVFYVDDDQSQLIRQVAQTESKELSAFMREIVTKYCKAEQQSA